MLVYIQNASFDSIDYFFFDTFFIQNLVHLIFIQLHDPDLQKAQWGKHDPLLPNVELSLFLIVIEQEKKWQMMQLITLYACMLVCVLCVSKCSSILIWLHLIQAVFGSWRSIFGCDIHCKNYIQPQVA